MRCRKCFCWGVCMIYLLILIVAIIAIYLIYKTYFLKYDTVVSFTGGLGAGKTIESVNVSIKLLKKQRRKVKLHNLLHKNDIWPTPQLYSSIPVRISKNEWAIKLTDDHLLLRSRIIPRSVVFIDEVGSFANQFEYRNPNIETNFDEIIRFFRHYLKGGYFVCNDQCSENIVFYVRRRMNTVFNLMHFKKYFGVFYTVKVRNINISEEIKTIEDENVEDGYKLKFGVIPLFKRYDTYCYSERYKTVPYRKEYRYTQYKKNIVMKVPKKLVRPLTTSDESEFKPIQIKTKKRKVKNVKK